MSAKLSKTSHPTTTVETFRAAITSETLPTPKTLLADLASRLPGCYRILRVAVVKVEPSADNEATRTYWCEGAYQQTRSGL